MKPNLLSLLVKQADGADNFRASIARSLLLSTSDDNAVVDEGTPAAPADPRIARLISLGIISSDQAKDLEMLAYILADKVLTLVDTMTATPDTAIPLNDALVSEFKAKYVTYFSKQALLEDRYNDALLFNGLSAEEAAGMARALIAVSGSTEIALWNTKAQLGS